MHDLADATGSRPRKVTELRTILVPTDFSGIANDAFGYARVLAEKFKARVVAVHVQEDTLSGLVEDYPSIDDLRRVLELQRREAEKKLAEVVRRHFPGSLEVELNVVCGVPHTEIVRLAERNEADVIVMATHGRGFMSHLLLGSTTEQVIRRSSVPVFVVRGATRRG